MTDLARALLGLTTWATAAVAWLTITDSWIPTP